MIIKILECNLDGTQVLIQREVPDNYFDQVKTPAPAEKPAP